MSKPVADTKWALSATKTEPSSGQKNAGWSVGQKPPAQWLNWWMDAVDQWKVWLAAFESTAHTWSALQTMAAGLTVSAGDLNVTLGNLTLNAGVIVADNNLSDHILGSTQIDGNLTVNANTSLAGTLALGGGITQTAGSNVLKDTQIQGNLDVDADLQVTGTSKFTGGMVIENEHIVGGGGEPAFQNGWVNQDASVYRGLRFWKDPMGVVHISGVVKSGAAGTAVFTLPVGYRTLALSIYKPLTLLDIVAGKQVAGQLTIDHTGQVSAYFTVAGGFDEVIIEASFRTT